MWELAIRNIGGIRDGSAVLEPGINTIQADNWQGKSSFIAAVQTVMGTTGMGATAHPLTEGASEGEVRLETEDRSYTATLSREGRSVTRSGEPYLTDPGDRVRARLFAFLGEENPVRAAVRTDGDLAELLGRPLDLENIEERIAALRQERRRVESELEEAERAAEQLPDRQAAVTRLEGELDELRDRYEELEAAADGGDGQDDLRDELSDRRATRDQLRGDVDRIENTVERTESRLEEKRQELEELAEPDELEIQADIDDKRDRIAELDTRIEILEDVHGANKRVLDEGRFHLLADVERSIAGDEITCWTCGAATTEEEFAAQLEALQATIGDLRSEREALRSDVEEIRRQREAAERKRRQRRELEAEIGDLKADLEDARRDLEDRRGRLEDVEAEIETLEERVEETAGRRTELQSEIKLKERELEREAAELATLEERSAERAELQERYEELADGIAELRDRKRTKQRELAEQFADAMDDVIERFEPGFESARLEPVLDGDDEIVDFDLVVAREGREASLDALSEGELELVGIVTALAGYKTFDVAEVVPAILLDDVGGLSSRRIRTLVEYLDDETELLVTTAYPEAGELQGNTVSPSEWDVVSDRQTSVP